jgi:hypothetical protein
MGRQEALLADLPWSVTIFLITGAGASQRKLMPVPTNTVASRNNQRRRRRVLSGDERAGSWTRGQVRRRWLLFARRRWRLLTVMTVTAAVPIGVAAWLAPTDRASRAARQPGSRPSRRPRTGFLRQPAGPVAVPGACPASIWSPRASDPGSPFATGASTPQFVAMADVRSSPDLDWRSAPGRRRDSLLNASRYVGRLTGTSV